MNEIEIQMIKSTVLIVAATGWILAAIFCMMWARLYLAKKKFMNYENQFNNCFSSGNQLKDMKHYEDACEDYKNGVYLVRLAMHEAGYVYDARFTAPHSDD